MAVLTAFLSVITGPLIYASGGVAKADVQLSGQLQFINVADGVTVGLAPDFQFFYHDTSASDGLIVGGVSVYVTDNATGKIQAYGYGAASPGQSTGDYFADYKVQDGEYLQEGHTYSVEAYWSGVTNSGAGQYELGTPLTESISAIATGLTISHARLIPADGSLTAVWNDTYAVQQPSDFVVSLFQTRIVAGKQVLIPASTKTSCGSCTMVTFNASDGVLDGYAYVAHITAATTGVGPTDELPVPGYATATTVAATPMFTANDVDPTSAEGQSLLDMASDANSSTDVDTGDYSGSWIDWSSGTVYEFFVDNSRFSGHSYNVTDAVTFANGARLQVLPASYSYDQMKLMAQAVMSDPADNQGIQDSSISDSLGKIMFAAPTDAAQTDTNMASVATAFESNGDEFEWNTLRFANGLVSGNGDAPGYQMQPPLYTPGKRIYIAGLGACSAGFWIKEGGAPFLTTAGHCVLVPRNVSTDQGQQNVFGFASEKYIGYDVPSGYENELDFGVIQGTLGTQKNPFTPSVVGKVEDNNNSYRAVDGIDVRQSEDNEVCYSAATTGSQCGFIQSTDATGSLQQGGYIRDHVRVIVDKPVMPGDSGGPVYAHRGNGKIRAEGLVSSAGSLENESTGEMQQAYTYSTMVNFLRATHYDIWNGGN